MVETTGMKATVLFVWPVLIVLALSASSCSRIKDKGQQLADTATAIGKELADTATQAGKQYAKDAIDKVIPHFDAHTPDTKYNKERFTEFLGIPLTPDVKNIYCYGDAMGIDASYYFVFSCDSSTARKVIEMNQLKRDTINTNTGFTLPADIKWWNEEHIRTLDKYSYEGEHQLFTHFWYDAKERQAYYLTYDM